MKLKCSLGLLVLLLLMGRSYGQVINTDSLNAYPESVVLKVFEVASKTTLTVSEQIALADLLTDEEQTLYDIVMNGGNANTIDSVKQNYKYRFNSLLTAAELDAYYTAKSLKNANRVAKLTAAMLQQKYNTDATLQQYFNDILLARETAINKVLQQFTDSTVLDTNVFRTIVAYDGLIDKYIKAATGSAYLNNKLNFLDDEVGLDAAQRSNLSNTYYNLCLNNTEGAYADVFNVAFNSVFTNVSDTPYYKALYGKEISNNARTTSQVAIAGYVKRYNLSAVTTQSLMPVLRQRDLNIALVNKLYPNYSKTKSLLIDTITGTYQPIIDSLIAMDGNVTNATQLDIAIKYAQSLHLEDGQVEQLKSALTDLNKQRETFKLSDAVGEFDSKVFESKILSKVLSEEQYTTVLTLKYQSMANSMAVKDWETLINYGDEFLVMFEKTETETALTNFHLAYLIAFYRNAYDRELQYASCKRLNEIMPEALRVLIEKFEYKTAYGDGSDTFFQW